MDYQDQSYNNIVDTLINTFGEVLSRDVIYSIVENFKGALDESANAVMNIIMDVNNATGANAPTDSKVNAVEQTVQKGDQKHKSNSVHTTTETNIDHIFQPVSSYANASRLSKPPVNLAPNVTKATDTSSEHHFWTQQIEHILALHENGARTLIILRGLPGSGKTYLAKHIIDAVYYTTNQHYHTHILSTDDYFMHNGVYMFDKMRIQEAHEWNHNRARQAMIKGVSPVIIDNTNIELWEMKFYVTQGVKNGYIIEIVEPSTPWAKKVNQLANLCSHNVPIELMRRKLENFKSGINGGHLMKLFSLRYSPSYTPPILRNIPPFALKLREESINLKEEDTVSLKTSSDNEIQNQKEHSHENSESSLSDTTNVSPTNNIVCDQSDDSEASALVSYHLYKFVEIQKCLEEMDKVEKEWENGDDWNSGSQGKNPECKSSDIENSKPQRRNKPMRSGTIEKFLTSDEICQDWSRCSMFLPSWGENSCSTQESSAPIVENKSSSTCIESGDTDIDTSKKLYKVINTTPRNINEHHIAVNIKKMAEKWMLDKGTSTNNNQLVTDNFRCQYEEQHFAAFRKLFKNISRSDLRDIFDNCCGDVNWAVEIVLDGVATKQLNIVDSYEYSDTESETHNDNVEMCQCLSAYDIVPGHNDLSSPPLAEENESFVYDVPSSSKSKSRKGTNFISESSMQLKRQIEQNVVISDTHYSDHCLKIRKLRRGEVEKFSDYTDEAIRINDEQSETETSDINAADNNEGCSYSNYQFPSRHSSIPSTSKTEMPHEDSSVYEDVESTVNIVLGKEFISQLDDFFGRKNIDFPSSVIPKINMPISLLNEINALWMESLMNQLEEDAKQSEIMLQQDEEFARQLAVKEAELIQAGKEPEVPDFKEIMDMDFALSVYQKDVAEWRNSMPVDLAAKLTRDKLYNLFPEMSKDILSELLMALDNNFQQTVESLLISTGKSGILETENGVSKFVMEKEMERQEKLLEAEKKAVAEVEWPLTAQTEPVDMAVVQRYRDKAEDHLKLRDINYQRAQEFITRGIPQVATHYSEIAGYHKRKYEMASSMAAASLMQVHAANCSDNATIDLHYLRVAEAKESVDLFIDTHIQNLREMQDKNGVKFHTLFFITGRGLHSNGGPRIKPAIKKRLTERGLAFSERNPGLLTAKVCADDKLSHQVA